MPYRRPVGMSASGLRDGKMNDGIAKHTRRALEVSFAGMSMGPSGGGVAGDCDEAGEGWSVSLGLSTSRRRLTMDDWWCVVITCPSNLAARICRNHGRRLGSDWVVRMALGQWDDVVVCGPITHRPSLHPFFTAHVCPHFSCPLLRQGGYRKQTRRGMARHGMAWHGIA